MEMSSYSKSRVLDNLCVLSQDISRRILTCEKRDRDSAKVSYEDLVAWFDVVGDAIEVINDGGARHAGRG